MKNENYQDLLYSLSFLANLNQEDVDLLQTSGGIRVDDVFFYLLDAGEEDTEDADALYMYCIFGVPPPGKAEEVMRVLLQENMGMFPYAGPTFMINPDDRNVVLAYRFSLQNLTPEHLFEILKSVSQEALKWRQTYYLDEGQFKIVEEPTGTMNYSFV